MSLAHHFTIDSTDFGVGSVTFLAELSGTFTLEIVGSESIAANIGASDTHPFRWIIYPPKFYLRGAVLTTNGDVKTLTIDDDVLDNYDIALYLIEHNDVFGRLTIYGDGVVTFSGTTSINGTNRLLNISCLAMLTP